MKCIACGRETNFMAVKEGVEAAFCHYHYPMQRRIDFLLTITIG